MTSARVAEQVTKVVAKQLGSDLYGDHVASDSKLIEDLGADSLDLVEIQMCVEDEFGIMVPDEDFDKVVTVGDLAQLVERILNG